MLQLSHFANHHWMQPPVDAVAYIRSVCPNVQCSHSLMGMDQTFASYWGDKTETKSDIITLGGGSPEVIGGSIVNGLMMDFSFAGKLP